MKQPYISLNNDIQIPQIGLGVWQTKDGAEVERAVSAALDAGYRLIDTAAVYGNESGVGNAIAASSIARKDIFITTKLWNSDQGYDATLAAFDKSLARLGLDYIDLYLIHWPTPAKDTYIDTWRAFEKLYADGKVRAIGVSNFTIDHLKRLLANSNVAPAVNQVELHPYLPQTELRTFCQLHGIAVESWSPLGGSGGDIMTNDIVQTIAANHHVSPAQVLLRWHLQNNLIVIPKSVHPERIVQNIDVFGFALSPGDMAQLATLETGKRFGPDPDTANFT